MRIAINGWFLGQETAGSGQYLHHMLAHLPQYAPDDEWVLLVPARSSIDTKNLLRQTLASLTAEDSPIHIQIKTLPLLPKLVSSRLAKVWWEQVSVPRLARAAAADLLWVPYWAAPLWQPIPTVVTIHDLIPLLLPEYRGGRLQRLYTRLVSITARRCRAILTVSHAGARDVVQHLGIAGERVFAIHHGPNQENAPAHDRADLEKTRQKYALPARYFLYLGGFDARKNVRSTLAAYRRYLDLGGNPAVRMVIAGRLPTEQSNFFPNPKEMVSELDLTEQVDFCGWVDEADKPALYALSTAYLFPSTYEGFGMMLLEAMRAETPVVTSRC